MAFRKLEAPTKGISGTGIKAGLIKRGDTPARLALTIAARVLAGFQTGDPFKERWRAMLGEGADEGTIQLMLDSDGEFRLTVLKGRGAIGSAAGRLSLGVVAGTVDERIAGISCRFERKSNLAILIVLPPALLLIERAPPAVDVPARAFAGGRATPAGPRKGLGSY